MMLQQTFATQFEAVVAEVTTDGDVSISGRIRNLTDVVISGTIYAQVKDSIGVIVLGPTPSTFTVVPQFLTPSNVHGFTVQIGTLSSYGTYTVEVFALDINSVALAENVVVNLPFAPPPPPPDQAQIPLLALAGAGLAVFILVMLYNR